MTNNETPARFTTRRVHIGTLHGAIAAARGEHATADINALYEEVSAAAAAHGWSIGFETSAARANTLFAELTVGV